MRCLENLREKYEPLVSYSLLASVRHKVLNQDLRKKSHISFFLILQCWCYTQEKVQIFQRFFAEQSLLIRVFRSAKMILPGSLWPLIFQRRNSFVPSRSNLPSHNQGCEICCGNTKCLFCCNWILPSTKLFGSCILKNYCITKMHPKNLHTFFYSLFVFNDCTYELTLLTRNKLLLYLYFDKLFMIESLNRFLEAFYVFARDHWLSLSFRRL